jgi:hypothetical protein
MKALLFQLVLLLMGTTFALQAQEAAIEKKNGDSRTPKLSANIQSLA